MSEHSHLPVKRRMAAGALALSLLATPSLALVANAATVTEDSRSSGFASLRLTRILPVEHKTVIVEDADLPMDVEVVKTEGSDGVKHVYTTAGYKESDSPIYREVVVTKPVDRVILRGTANELPVVAEPAPEPTPEPVVEEEETASRSDDRQEGEAQLVAPPPSTSGQYSLSDLMFMGVINWGGYKFTYYSQSVLPGGGLSIPGRHVNAGGFVSDGDGYIVLAGSAPMGTVYPTPFGWPGKIYDRGTYGNHLDVYTR